VVSIMTSLAHPNYFQRFRIVEVVCRGFARFVTYGTFFGSYQYFVTNSVHNYYTGGTFLGVFESGLVDRPLKTFRLSKYSTPLSALLTSILRLAVFFIVTSNLFFGSRFLAPLGVRQTGAVFTSTPSVFVKCVPRKFGIMFCNTTVGAGFHTHLRSLTPLYHRLVGIVKYDNKQAVGGGTP
jgi:uncharacterized PurR-regulated membrane protein YhhQ (DUF165 family)